MNVTEKALKELRMFKDLEPFHESQNIKDLRFFIEFHILHHLTVRHTLAHDHLHMHVFCNKGGESLLTLRRLMSYIYGAPILDVSRSHTTTQHSR